MKTLNAEKGSKTFTSSCLIIVKIVSADQQQRWLLAAVIEAGYWLSWRTDKFDCVIAFSQTFVLKHLKRRLYILYLYFTSFSMGESRGRTGAPHNFYFPFFFLLFVLKYSSNSAHTICSLLQTEFVFYVHFALGKGQKRDHNNGFVQFFGFKHRKKSWHCLSVSCSASAATTQSVSKIWPAALCLKKCIAMKK